MIGAQLIDHVVVPNANKLVLVLVQYLVQYSARYLCDPCKVLCAYIHFYYDPLPFCCINKAQECLFWLKPVFSSVRNVWRM